MSLRLFGAHCFRTTLFESIEALGLDATGSILPFFAQMFPFCICTTFALFDDKP